MPGKVLLYKNIFKNIFIQQNTVFDDLKVLLQMVEKQFTTSKYLAHIA